jgi:uncharacterized membrane protein
MSIPIILLRALHILGGVFWAGGAAFMYGFVIPSVKATQPESGRFMQYLAGKSGVSAWMTTASLVCLVAGLALYGPVSGQLNHDWFGSTHGIVLTTGAVIGLLAALEGMFVVGPAARKLGAIGREVSAAGGPPTPEHQKGMAMLQRKLISSGTRGAWLTTFAALCMAVARYM